MTLAEGDVPSGDPLGKPWYRRAAAWAVISVGTILTGVLATVGGTSLNAKINPTPALASTPTGIQVTELAGASVPSGDSPSPPGPSRAAGAYTGPRGTGWSSIPTSLANDFVSVLVTMDPQHDCHGATGWVFPQPPSQLEYPAAEEAQELADSSLANFSDWAARNGGVPRSDNVLSLTLQNRNHATVVITQIGVRVVGRSSPNAQSAAQVEIGCGGGVSPAYFTANLDSSAPQVKAVAGEQGGQTVNPVLLPRKLADQDPEVWLIHFVTSKCDCTFYPYFTWTSGGLTGMFDVTNHGQPWRVSSAGSLATLMPDIERRVWVPEQ